MAVKLLFLAQCSDWIGFGEMSLALDHPQTLENFLRDSALFEPLLKNRKMLKVAVNHKLTDFSEEIKDHDEIAFLPPYSGG